MMIKMIMTFVVFFFFVIVYDVMLGELVMRDFDFDLDIYVLASYYVISTLISSCFLYMLIWF